MSSNCYIVWDDELKGAICIDPASEYSLQEINFLNAHTLYLDYIILTHEHTDHTWGVNALLEKYSNTKVICSEKCKENLQTAGNAYFRLYYERKNYIYTVSRIDLTTESINNQLKWRCYTIKYIPSPGHSMGSICIDINGNLFTGDTIMQYKNYINKRNGDREIYNQSVQKIVAAYSDTTQVYPGHGEIFFLKDKDIIIGK